MFGIDISNYQKGIDLSKGNYDFAFIKATEGTSLTDRCFHKFAVKLTELNKLMGCYHFARPAINNTPEKMKRAADYFIKAIESENLIGRAVLALDWETEPIAREDLLSAWLEEVEEKTGILPIVYANTSHMKIISNYNCMKNRRTWLAKWPTIEQIELGHLPSGAVIPGQYNQTIWQYSSNGQFPNYIGRVDLDYTTMTEYDWNILARPFNTPDMKTRDMEWAIEAGIFKGFSDGTLRVNEPLTRGQAATVIRRTTEYILKYISNNIE